MEGVVAGRSDSEIAKSLGLSVRTVEAMVKRFRVKIEDKTGEPVKNRSELARWWWRYVADNMAGGPHGPVKLGE